ncbi:SUGAR TRANSPORTER [Halomonas citrativorans]|uniref:SUGAR TRANSPORTER n=1 Tax=Halomonas citrativorans TaxID=2742612 RepID=A0A1R4I4N1_9GAMM|nr:AraD1 family protein [Halomonas citrativorans]SJN14772.1 SUGAR TRANSPORTER [Halomonas citrativorans]
MRIVQVKTSRGIRAAVVESSIQLRVIDYPGGTYALAKAALDEGTSLTAFIESHRSHDLLDYNQAIDLGLLLPPLTHPDPAHCFVTGTGLTHLGSADTRSAMHASVQANNEELTDSMRMFKLGVEGGKPLAGTMGAQPEWFYKGDGSIVVPPESPFTVPFFAEDAGEEPELVGLYINATDGTPYRVGYAVGNEFSDHITERANYLWLAHSKLRACSFGPELFLGELPDYLEGTSRIVREDKILWEKTFLTGEANMAHSLANLEYHHFKYAQFRRPGDVHVHYFGTATLSFADNISVRDGDRFEIDLPLLGRKLCNPVKFMPEENPAMKKVQSI